MTFMDRRGQTWCHHDYEVVFTVLRSYRTTLPNRPHWIHNVVFLENARSPHLVGTKQELQEADSRVFERWLKRVV